MRISDWSSDVCSSDLWSQDRNMVEVERLSFRIELVELLQGQIVLPEVELERPRLVLERNAEGDANWAFEPSGVAEAAAPDDRADVPIVERLAIRSEEHTSELQSLMRTSYAVFCLKKK